MKRVKKSWKELNIVEFIEMVYKCHAQYSSVTIKEFIDTFGNDIPEMFDNPFGEILPPKHFYKYVGGKKDNKKVETMKEVYNYFGVE